MEKRVVIHRGSVELISSKNASSNSLDSDSKSSSLNSKHGAETVCRDRPFIYLNGEELKDRNDEVTLVCPYRSPSHGTLYITNYRLFFQSRQVNDRDPPIIVDVALGAISRVEKIGGASSRGENSYGIEIFCKDVRNLRFAHNQQNHSRRTVFEKLTTYAFPLSFNGKLFAFSYSEQFPENGWNVYEPLAELRRMGVNNDTWRITKINENYTICDSYPAVWAVPKAASDEF